MGETIVVIGANHAGTAAINTILDQFPGNRVIAFDMNSNISFLGCGMALWIGKQIQGPDGLFYSSKEKKLITLDEYINHMEEGQKDIYFVSGDKVEKIDQLPIVKKVKEKGYEILYLTDNVDEFVLQSLMNYKEKNFKNISQGDLDLDSEEEKKELEKKAEESKDMLDGLKEALGEKVKEVKLSTRLVDDPVCLSADEGMSFEMEKVLSAMPDGNPYGMKATRILEINPSHPIFTALQNVYAKDKDAVKDYAQLLYDQALLIEGFPIDDPAEFSRKICEFMVKAAN